MVIVVGGGWGGCAAAFAATLAGADVTLVERTDMLLGTGLVGGIMCNNGRLTAFEEAAAMGGESFMAVIKSVARHHNISFPGHKHAMLYDVTKIEPAMRGLLIGLNVNLLLQTRVVAVEKKGDKVLSVRTADGKIIEGSSFVDTTGSAGPQGNCLKYGSGCAMCILRCPTFGPRVSVTAKSGISEMQAGEGFPHFEAMSGSCKLDKNSLGSELVKKLENDGVLVVPIKPDLQNNSLLGKKACQQYALHDFTENLVVLDTGHAKLMTPYFPLDVLRTLRGFENARYADPYSGGRGNSIRFMSIAPCDNGLRVGGTENLFCAGEKTGPLVGHTEAIVTGFLAGHNAARCVAGMEPLELPESLVSGDLIAFMHREMKTNKGLKKKYTFSGSVYFDRMKQLGFYLTDCEDIRIKVSGAGMEGVYKKKLLP
ncbi:MAG TPA: FAD-dependent oxidoreductase [Clostridia bacterium]|nr:FAD-dependent oxidoreductase [Clostridia bacterium]